jgi:alpha-L-fucosidase 2
MLTKSAVYPLQCAIGIGVVAAMTNLPLYGQLAPGIAPWLAANNVTWTNPGPTSAQSMPLGNGDIGLNVWVETNGAVDFYIGKSDAWGDNVQGDEGFIKIGGVHLTASPHSFAPGTPFRQTLMLHEGQIEIAEGAGANAMNYLIWVDANNPVIRVEAASSGTPVTVQASLLDWRLGRLRRGRASSDAVLSGQTNYIGWFHRNKSSDDPHIANWTLGAIIQAAGMTNTSPDHLISAPVTSQLISIYPLTTRTGTVGQWLDQLQSNISRINGLDLNTTRTNSRTWWDGFWHRSWIFITGDQSATDTTEGYVLQRFISACAGRGAYPIKFNGSLFVVENSNPKAKFTPDGRDWGGRYWMQNTRLIYWPMLESGDFDMMLPFFNMYEQMLPANAAQITRYYGHGGSYFDEVSPFWGGVTYAAPSVPGGYHSQYFTGILELSMMMLDYYDYTEDTNFLVNTLLPTASAGLDFYDQHFGLDSNGKMLLAPVNAIETYWKADDPAPDIAGLTAVLPRMLALPNNLISTTDRAKWSRMLTEVPPLPIGSRKGNTVLLPYTGPQTNRIENGENPELYAVFPYRIYGLGKSNLQLAIMSYNSRLFRGLTSADWTQDGIEAAMLGLTGIARQYAVYNMTNKDPSLKFPAFWRQMNDYLPSQDTGCVGEETLQKMIMQTDGNKIMLLPAWPIGWNAIFKLHAPFNTTVQGTISNGVITNLVVNPSSRQADVILMASGFNHN